MNAYEYRQEQRRERLERRAARLRGESDDAFQRSRSLTAGIPLGQPILVGHHSEKRHRRTLQQSDDAMRRGFARLKAAEEAARAAAGVGTAGIASDDPDAPEKLRERIAELEALQEQDKQANAYWRKHGTMAGYPGVSDDRAPIIDAQIRKGYSWEQQPAPSYRLSNRNANIRRLRLRLAQVTALHARAAEAPRAQTITGGCRVTEDREDFRVLLTFPRRLTTEEYKHVRSRGFVWARSRGCFVRKLNAGGVNAATDLAEWFGHQAGPAPAQPQEG